MGNGDIAPFILNIDNIMAALTPAPTECESKPKHSVCAKCSLRSCRRLEYINTRLTHTEIQQKETTRKKKKQMTKMSFSSADYFFCKFTFHSYCRIQSSSVLTSWVSTVQMTSVLYDENVLSGVPQVKEKKKMTTKRGILEQLTDPQLASDTV